MKKLFLLVFAISLHTFTSAQYLLVENYEPKDQLENGQPNLVKIPYSKYTYTNGLTVIVSEDHTNPLVNINVTYKVGSANDYADRTGMAYMVYKLMDKGSKHLPKGEYQKTIKQYGGKTLSEITRDRTSFSVTVPKNVLATILWMESDRQAYFLDSLTQDKFDNTKLDIIAAMYDSLYHQKYGLPDVLAQKNMYAFGHPYTWPEFGMMDHYQAFTITDLKKFYLDWYGTNNTILTITGDIKTQEVLDLVNTYFGKLTKAPQSTSNLDDLFNRIAGSGGIEFTEPRYISYKVDVPYPMLKIVFNTVPRYHQDEKALNTIAYLLGQGEKSILYNELVKKGYAVKVNAQHRTYKYLGEFSIDILANPDTSLKVILAKVNTVLNDIARNKNLAAYIPANNNSNGMGFPVQLPLQNNAPNQTTVPIQPANPIQKQGVPANNLLQQPRNTQRVIENRENPERIQAQSAEIIFPVISSLKLNELIWIESLQNKGFALAEGEMVSGKPASFSTAIVDYNNITPEKFSDAFNRYILTGAKLYVSIVPKDKESLIVARDNIVERELKTIITPTLEKDLVYRYPVKEINKKKPKVSDLSVKPNIVIKTDSALNGMMLNFVQDISIPLAGFIIRMDASMIMKLLPQIDVSKLLATKYNEWFEAQGLHNPLKAASTSGSRIEFVPNEQYVDIHVTCPKDNFMIVKEALLHFLNSPENNIIMLYPLFIQSINDSSVIKNFRITDFGFVIKNISDNSGSKVISEDSLRKKSRATHEMKLLSSTFSKLDDPDNLSSVTYGNIDQDQYTDFRMRLSNWIPQGVTFDGARMKSPNSNTSNLDDLQDSVDGNIFFMEDENIETAKIVVEYLQIPVEVSTNYYTGQLANYILALSAANQLGKKLSANDYILKIKAISYVRNKKECYAVILTVNSDKIYEAYSVLFKELDNFKYFKPDKNEFKSLKNEYLYKDIVSNETFSQKELFVNKMIINNIPADIYNYQNEYSSKIKASKIGKFWKANYFQENARILVIGNEAKLQTNLSKTGNKIIKIDKSGTIIK